MSALDQHAAAVARGACLCDTCRRLVTGSEGDVRVCIVDGEANLVLCAACFGQDTRRDRWLEWRSLRLSDPDDPWLAACGSRRVG